MSCGSPFPLFRLSKVFSASPGKLSSVPGEMCKISYAMSITSVISYATPIGSEWWWGFSLATFRWWHRLASLVPGPDRSPRRCRRFLCQGGRVSAPLRALGIETEQDSCRCRSRPETGSGWERRARSCPPALAWVTVLPPSQSHGHASPRQSGNGSELQVARFVASGNIMPRRRWTGLAGHKRIMLLRGASRQERRQALLIFRVAAISCALRRLQKSTWGCFSLSKKLKWELSHTLFVRDP